MGFAQPLRVCYRKLVDLRVRNMRTACHCRGKDRRGGGAVPKEWSGSGTPDSLFFGCFGSVAKRRKQSSQKATQNIKNKNSKLSLSLFQVAFIIIKNTMILNHILPANPMKNCGLECKRLLES